MVNRRGHRLRALVVACCAQLALSTIFSTSVLAACNPIRSHDNQARYVALAQTRTNLTGVKAQIQEYDPYYSGSNGTGTNSTIMLLRRSPTVQWAQLGWFKSKIDDGSVIRRQVGIEFYVSSGDNRFYFFPPKAVGALTEYKILYIGGNYYDFRVNGATIAQTSPIGPPTEYQIFGETHDVADQMPGGKNVGSREEFQSSRYYTGATFVSNVVTIPIGTAHTTLYGFANLGGGGYEIWDKACAT